MDFVNALVAKEETVCLSDDEIEQRREAREELARVLLMEETLWRQKSRALWLRGGDQNTKFFNRTTNLCRKFKFMSAVAVEGNRYETIENMKSSIHGFYKDLSAESGG